MFEVDTATLSEIYMTSLQKFQETNNFNESQGYWQSEDCLVLNAIALGFRVIVSNIM